MNSPLVLRSIWKRPPGTWLISFWYAFGQVLDQLSRVAVFFVRDEVEKPVADQANAAERHGKNRSDRRPLARNDRVPYRGQFW